MNRRATGPGPLRTARGAGRRVVGLRLAVLFDREVVEAGLRFGLVLRDRVLELRDEELPVLRVVDVLLLRDPGGEDVRVAMVTTLRSRHSRHTHHRSACLAGWGRARPPNTSPALNERSFNAAGYVRAQASMTTGMIIGRRRWVLDTQRPMTRRTVCCSW